jgi:hypothetical protein
MRGRVACLGGATLPRIGRRTSLTSNMDTGIGAAEEILLRIVPAGVAVGLDAIHVDFATSPNI